MSDLTGCELGLELIELMLRRAGQTGWLLWLLAGSTNWLKGCCSYLRAFRDFREGKVWC